MKREILITMAAMLLTGSCEPDSGYLKEIRITTDLSKNHDLDNNDNFSPDGQWLVYDTRDEVTAIAGCPTIERVNIATGKTEVLYEIRDNRAWGPGAGAASYHPLENMVIFIHGLPGCTRDNPYQQWRRTGVIVRDDQPGVPLNMDSRDISFPFTAGALRGGTHRHEWSRDGQFVGYTYNDAVMKHLEDSTGKRSNLRTIAVSSLRHKVTVQPDGSGETIQGSYYSAVVVRVVPDPEPGSDEISNAASDSWVGQGNYLKPDGKKQIARAFLGKVRSRDGKEVDELFVVDIPDSLNIPGEYGPLEGTRSSFPMPPMGTVQRRLTYTAETRYPGCSGVVRSSPNGRYISYCAADSNGIKQVFVISPLGGDPMQVTMHATDVQPGVRWSPDRKTICYVWDNSIVVCSVSDRPFNERWKRLTARTAEAPMNHVWSGDGNTIAFNRMVKVEGKNEKKKQIFIIKPDSTSYF